MLKADDALKNKIRETLPDNIRKHPLRTRAWIASKYYRISRTTLWRVIKADIELEKAVAEAEEGRQKSEADAVERTWVKKLLRGKGSSTDYIFYLTNHKSETYKHRNALIGSLNVSASAGAAVNKLEEIDDEDLIATTKAIFERDNLS